MKRDLMARENVEVLAQFAASKVLLGFDFDGTLAPIVSEPDQARLRPATREVLAKVARLYPCVVISGRAVADVRERVRGVGFLEVIGNHGLEPWRRSEEFAKKVRAWLPRLLERLDPFKGVVIEDKGYSIAVHYRKSREKRAARQAIIDAAAALGPVRVVGGHQVVNLLPDGAPHKGLALAAARDRLGCDTAFYVGDDETDEDVFSRDEPGRLLSVRVEHRASSRAAFFIASQGTIDALLQKLVALRARRPARASFAKAEVVA
jgi:trehalose 6-phosphate phosphatase